MPTLTIVGEIDPFLHVNLQRGESISCESGAMVMMESGLELTGRMQGGFLGALTRTLANGESFFQQHIEATGDSGDCLLAPVMPGGMQILDVGTEQYNLSDGAFVACTSKVDVKAQMQSIGTALFGGTGGFLIGKTSGHGQVVVNGFGSLFILDVVPGKETTVDNGHVVAWDASLRYEISVSTSQSRGMLGNLMNSVTSGEGMVLKFSGQGKVVICSRNRSSFAGWMRQEISA
ncbi:MULTISPECIES: TIGR00266 family protein [Vitreoscilla]|uniref:TIGR00266 family protein n=1 Tax=Vitreoscilla stercoraria TaxID=61 RepID=A0ABY4ECD4_VITST|nr:MULTISPECIES: TIGR00266 family protein [Vitreoscilla]UOO92884.1 TIGR00266 family protein [Vitreoscilla stercoraria]